MMIAKSSHQNALAIHTLVYTLSIVNIKTKASHMAVRPMMPEAQLPSFEPIFSYLFFERICIRPRAIGGEDGRP